MYVATRMRVVPFSDWWVGCRVKLEDGISCVGWWLCNRTLWFWIYYIWWAMQFERSTWNTQCTLTFELAYWTKLYDYNIINLILFKCYYNIVDCRLIHSLETPNIDSKKMIYKYQMIIDLFMSRLYCQKSYIVIVGVLYPADGRVLIQLPVCILADWMMVVFWGWLTIQWGLKYS